MSMVISDLTLERILCFTEIDLGNLAGMATLCSGGVILLARGKNLLLGKIFLSSEREVKQTVGMAEVCT